MASQSMSYDDPSYTVVRQECKTSAVSAAGNQPVLTFRSKVACVVTGIHAIMGGSLAVTASMILTLLFNQSVRAVLTLNSTINELAESFTLTTNQTLTSMTDSFTVSTAAAYSADGHVSVIYEYRIVPGSTYSLNAALA
jgi:hypothetical protein